MKLRDEIRIRIRIKIKIYLQRHAKKKQDRTGQDQVVEY